MGSRPYQFNPCYTIPYDIRKHPFHSIPTLLITSHSASLSHTISSIPTPSTAISLHSIPTHLTSSYPILSQPNPFHLIPPIRSHLFYSILSRRIIFHPSLLSPFSLHPLTSNPISSQPIVFHTIPIFPFYPDTFHRIYHTHST